MADALQQGWLKTARDIAANHDLVFFAVAKVDGVWVEIGDDVDAASRSALRKILDTQEKKLLASKEVVPASMRAKRKYLTDVLAVGDGRKFYRRENVPEWWPTDIPFMSPNLTTRGCLSTVQLHRLCEAAKEAVENERQEEPVRKKRRLEAPSAATNGAAQSTEEPSGSRLRPRKERPKAAKNLSPREEVLALCSMEKPMPFQSLQFQNLQKIGEGTFGEVYTTGENVIKIIPIEGEILVNGERQKSFKEIKKEILITKELSELRERIFNRCETFVKSLGFKIVCGKYPIELLREWDRFETSKGSENDRPDFLPDDQLFIIFEFENSGVALESVEIESVAQGVSIVKQVCCALAVAEKALQFEHRDLHWGNVLVRASVEDTIIFRLDGRDVSVRSQGVEVKIIDFTLSRITKDNKTIYIDLKNDVSLFAGQGDSQFDIYREMKKKNKNDWAAFSPFSNILWAHYICQKIFEAKLQAGLDEIRDFYKKVLSYKSCYRLVTHNVFF